MGFIYLLYNDAGYGYIGQTSKSMNCRIGQHKSPTNLSRSNKLGDFEWIVLEEVPNECLLDFERYYYDIYFEMFPNMLVNRRKPLNSKPEWCSVNKEKLKVNRKKWRDNHPEKMSAIYKAQGEKYKEKIAANRKARYERMKAV